MEDGRGKRVTGKVTRSPVVDGREPARLVVKRALKRLKVECEVVAVASGRGAPEASVCERKPLDSIIMDLKIPNVDGADLMDELSARPSAGPVVWKTGRGCQPYLDDVDWLDVTWSADKSLEARERRHTVLAALQSGTVRHGLV